MFMAFFIQFKMTGPLLIFVLNNVYIQACREVTVYRLYMMCIDVSYIHFSVQIGRVYYTQTFVCDFFSLMFHDML